jgi:hypothetical protein
MRSLPPNHYAVDMLYIVDHTVYEYIAAQHHNYTHATMKHLIEYMSVVAFEVS